MQQRRRDRGVRSRRAVIKQAHKRELEEEFAALVRMQRLDEWQRSDRLGITETSLKLRPRAAADGVLGSVYSSIANE